MLAAKVRRQRFLGNDGSGEPNLLVFLGHRVQQQANERVFKEHVDDVPGEQHVGKASPEQDHFEQSSSERQEGCNQRNLVAALHLVGDAPPSVKIRSEREPNDQRDDCTELAEPQERQECEEGIEVEQELGDAQGLREAVVEPAAGRHG